MTPRPNAHSDIDEQIRVVYYWRCMIRGRWLVAASIVLCLAGGVAYLFFAAPVYVIHAKLRIGQVAGVGLLEPVDVLSPRLLAEYGEDVADGIKRKRPFLKRASPPKGVAGTVDLVAEGHSPEDASGLLRRVLAEVGKTHDEIYTRNVAVLRARMETVDEQSRALLRLDAETSSLTERLKKENLAQASLMVLERGRVTELLRSLEFEKVGLAPRLISPQTYPTALVNEFQQPSRPASPKKSTVFIVALLAGVVLGTALAIWRDPVRLRSRSPGH